uniref:Tensin 2b n=1 Tax=Cynoglossus semilaevis TaxID=244447 RepID=A0A3P8V368_CYNSE
MKGREYRKNDPSIKVDYNTADAVIRWDSYENFNLHHQDSMENIAHTRGPLDGSLYAQVRKRRPGSTAAAASPNGCLTSSPTVKPQTHSQPVTPTYSSYSSRSSLPVDHLHRSTNCPEIDSKNADEEERRREKAKGKEKDRETAILDDVNPLTGLRREHSCCGRVSAKCGEGGWERERGSCLSNGHCLAQCNSSKKNPKSQTLPALLPKSVSPSLNSAQMDFCHRHSAHPLPELPWERPAPPPPQPCLHRPYYPYSAPEHPHPHSLSLPMSNRLCSGEECQFFHYTNHSPSSHLSHPSLPTSPYREMFFSSPTQSPGCPCRECSSRREHHLDSVRTFQALRPDQTENPQWCQGAGVQQTREAPPLWESENPWDTVRETDFWQCKSAAPSFRGFHPSLGQSPNQEQPRIAIAPHQSYHTPQSVVDVRDGASSGYHTPPPRHSCPCAPYQASPSESHESRGYASGYQSESASPLLASSPSPGRGKLPETPSRSSEQHHEVRKAKEVVEDNISQGSENKSDSNGPSSTPGLDSDHDYTLIGGSSPTHTEDSVAADSPPQSQETSVQPEPTTSSNQSTLAPTNIQTQVFSSPPNTTTQPLNQQSLSPDKTSGAARTTGGAERSQQSHSSSYVPIIIPPVQMQLNGSALACDTSPESSSSVTLNTTISLTSSPATTSPNSPISSPEPHSPPQCSSLSTDTAGHRLTPDRDSSADKPPSPVPDGYNTPTFPLASYYYQLLNVPHVPYTGYTAVTIPAIQPPLPEKKRLSSSAGSLNGHNTLQRVSSAPSPTPHVTFSTAIGTQRRGSAQANYKDKADVRVNSKFVQDSSKYWYKPGISRDQAIAVLKDKEPGTFLIRDSNSFQGAYGLALKVATPPPSASACGLKVDPLEQLVRHFLIETGPQGVKIKGCQNESYFGSLSALVYQHSITPISLPCALRIPEKDLVGELQEVQSSTSTSTAADLLKQGAACNVLYLNSVETESLTGPEAVSKATKCTLSLNPRPVATVVHFKVSSQGITLTDNKRRLFFRRHYPLSSVTFSSLDPQDKRMFGFVARRTGSATENVCHLFAEMDPEQPAVAIVNFINKVMLGPQLRR